jgi:hypothetical protein
MSRRLPRTTNASAASLDLNAFDKSLARLLPSLLFMRDGEALVRWSKSRSWVDNAMAGDASADLPVIDMAIAYLVERVTDDARSGTSPGDEEGEGTCPIDACVADRRRLVRRTLLF